MKKMMMNKEFFEGLQEYMLKKAGLDAEPEDIMISVKAFLEFVAITLGEEKSESEEVALELPGFIEFTASYRENNGEGNFGVGVVAGEEFKKRIKDDELLEDLNDDEE